MTTPEERDYIGEVIREDAATRCAVIGTQNVNSAMSTIDELRQQLADVSNERDLLRAALSGMLFEFDDGVGEDWSSDLLDYARTLCDAVEFKPSTDGTIMSKPKRWQVGDVLFCSREPYGFRREREIVEVRTTGYGWKYPDFGRITPSGAENYFWTENSNDQMLEHGWEKQS